MTDSVIIDWGKEDIGSIEVVEISEKTGIKGSFKLDVILLDNPNLTHNTIEEAYLALYPNPSNNLINLSLEANGKQMSYELNLFDLLGNKVFTSTLYKEQKDFTLDISHLQNGVYILELKNDSQRITRKVLKQ